MHADHRCCGDTQHLCAAGEFRAGVFAQPHFDGRPRITADVVADQGAEQCGVVGSSTRDGCPPVSGREQSATTPHRDVPPRTPPVYAARSDSRRPPSTRTGCAVSAVAAPIQLDSSRAYDAARPGGTTGGPSAGPVNATRPLSAQSRVRSTCRDAARGVTTENLVLDFTHPTLAQSFSNYEDRMEFHPPRITARQLAGGAADAPLLDDCGAVDTPMMVVDLSRRGRVRRRGSAGRRSTPRPCRGSDPGRVSGGRPDARAVLTDELDVTYSDHVDSRTPRCEVAVPDVDRAVDDLAARVSANPQAAVVLRQVLRSSGGLDTVRPSTSNRSPIRRCWAAPSSAAGSGSAETDHRHRHRIANPS